MECLLNHDSSLESKRSSQVGARLESSYRPKLPTRNFLFGPWRWFFRNSQFSTLSAFTGDRYRNSLFLNPGSTNHWLKLKLEGTRSNRAALGARIHVTVATPQGTRSIFKTVNSGGSFGSSPLQQEIGLGQASTIDSVQITWPGSGNQQQFRGLLRDRTYLLRENEAQARELHRPVSPFDLTRSHPHVAPARP